MKIQNCILWVIAILATAGVNARNAELSSGEHSSRWPYVLLSRLSADQASTCKQLRLRCCHLICHCMQAMGGYWWDCQGICFNLFPAQVTQLTPAPIYIPLPRCSLNSWGDGMHAQ